MTVKNCRGRRTVAVSLLVIALAVAGRARADDLADEADVQFRLGATRYQAGDFRSALEHFLASNRLVPNRNVLFNIARSYESLNQFPDAFRYFTRALEGETDAGARTLIMEALGRIAPNVAVLEVRTEPPGAKIYINRKDLGQRGNSPLRLGFAPGRYKIIAELAGYEDAESNEVTIQAGSETPVVLRLKRVLGTVRVTGEAAGASVRVDTEDSSPVCVVPCDVQLPPGPHTLFVAREGFQTSEVSANVEAGAVATVRPKLTQETGRLVVDSDEREALIEVDGMPSGFTPAVFPVAAGVHRVRVSLKGFRAVERVVRVEANKQERLEVELFVAEQVEAASRAVESLEDAPSSVSVIATQELRAMAYPTVWDAVRGQRGIFVSDGRGYPTVAVRGFSRPGDDGNRVLVLLDGQPMLDNWLWSSYAGYDFRTDIEDIERIEVVRGPGSVLYGTGAFSGVLNLVSRTRDDKPGLEAGYSAVEYGISRGRVRATVPLGKDAGVWASLSALHGAGRDFFFPQYVDDTSPDVGGHARGMDARDAGTFTGRFFWKAFTLQWSLHSHRKQVPTGAWETSIGDPGTRETDTRAMVEARFEPKLSATFQSLSRAHANFYGYHGDFIRLPDQGGREQETYDGRWAGLEQRFVYAPFERLKMTLGGEVQFHVKARYEDGDDVSRVTQSHTFQVGAGYAAADVTLSEITKISAASRVDVYSTFGASINPRLAFIVRPRGVGNFKLMFAKAFRAPSVYELTAVSGGGQIASPDLKPENIYSTELEFSRRFSPTVVGLVTSYANYIEGLVNERTFEDGSYAYVNTHVPVLTLGAEAEVRREWKDGWMLSASYSLQRSTYLNSESLEDLVSLSRNGNFREVANSPEHLAAVRAAAPIFSRALTAMTRISFEGPRFDRYDQPSDPVQRRSGAAVICDIMLTGTEKRFGLRYGLGLYNLFDWRYELPLSSEYRPRTLVQPGRTLMVNLSVTL